MNDAEKLYAALDEAYQPTPILPAQAEAPEAAAAVTLEEPYPETPESTGSGPADPGELTLVGAIQLRSQFEANPEAVLAMARRAFDDNLTIEQLQIHLDQTVAALEAPEAAAEMIIAARALEAAAAELPEDFDFDGYAPDAIPVNFETTQFEPEADWLGWVIYSGPTWIREGIAPKRYPFRSHAAHASGFRYPIGDDSTVALFSDFGTHLYHSRYIARHIESLCPPVAIHLGDVYYAGKRGELARRFIDDLQPVLANTELFNLAGNHEMYSAGIPFMNYIDQRRAAGWRQEGGYFSLVNNACQILGLDTQYYGGGRYRNSELLEWLRTRLAEGRRNGLTNILVSSDHPYRYGNPSTRDLLSDLAGVIPDVDLWFWGNTHYCALFSPGFDIPFIGSCIGHGGYPYPRERFGEVTPPGIQVHFLETRSRFHKWPAIRPDRGNNGFCMLTTSTAALELRYIDWMKKLRCTAVLTRANDGRLTIDSVTEHP